jgi:hypothetical protein
MISDVLFEALQQIERYQKESPDMYDEMKDEIEQVKHVMRRLLHKLDDPRPPSAPPNDGAFPTQVEGEGNEKLKPHDRGASDVVN